VIRGRDPARRLAGLPISWNADFDSDPDSDLDNPGTGVPPPAKELVFTGSGSIAIEIGIEIVVRPEITPSFSSLGAWFHKTDYVLFPLFVIFVV